MQIQYTPGYPVSKQSHSAAENFRENLYGVIIQKTELFITTTVRTAIQKLPFNII
jgi:ABC-type lipoprotein export system ATPase subunit